MTLCPSQRLPAPLQPHSRMCRQQTRRCDKPRCTSIISQYCEMKIMGRRGRQRKPEKIIGRAQGQCTSSEQDSVKPCTKGSSLTRCRRVESWLSRQTSRSPMQTSPIIGHIAEKRARPCICGIPLGGGWTNGGGTKSPLSAY